MNRREQLTIKLREDIGGAILELMREKPLERITVDELTRRANVGRVTYYRQFHSRQEAISYRLNRDWVRYARERDLHFETTPPLEYARAFFSFIYSLRETNWLLIENSCQSCIFDAMRYSFENLSEAVSTKEYYHDHFRAYGLLGLVEGWIQAGYDLTVDEMAELTTEYFYRV